MLSHAAVVHKFAGDCNQIIFQEVTVMPPGPGEVLIKSHASGLNFVDIYQKNGIYKTPQFPFVLGVEGVGEIIEIGEGNEDGWRVGERVGYIDVTGAHSEHLIRSMSRIVKIPDFLKSKDAAAILLKGMTAHILLDRVVRVSPGRMILVHSITGGVGSILGRWARSLGIKVIGTVGSPENRYTAIEEDCCDFVIDRSKEDFLEHVHDITNGAGVQVVYDGIGKGTFGSSLACLAPFGMMVSYGMANGPVEPFDISVLTQQSLYITRPSLRTYTKTTAMLRSVSKCLFDAINRGAVLAMPAREYALNDTAQAYIDLEARKLTGSTILVP